MNMRDKVELINNVFENGNNDKSYSFELQLIEGDKKLHLLIRFENCLIQDYFYDYEDDFVEIDELASAVSLMKDAFLRIDIFYTKALEISRATKNYLDTIDLEKIK